MDFEWDRDKDEANRAKHGVGFSEAREIFDLPRIVRQDTRQAYGEDRFISVGSMAGDPPVVLVVVHTSRGSRTRLISARKASATERKAYHDHIQEEKRGDRPDPGLSD